MGRDRRLVRPQPPTPSTRTTPTLTDARVPSTFVARNTAAAEGTGGTVGWQHGHGHEHRRRRRRWRLHAHWNRAQPRDRWHGDGDGHS